MKMENQIVFLAPERLHTIITSETAAGRRADLAEALLQLLELQSRLILQPDQVVRPPRRGTILPQVKRSGDSILLEFDWGVIENPETNGSGGIRGQHVMNGGLIQHRDLRWSIHT